MNINEFLLNDVIGYFRLEFIIKNLKINNMNLKQTKSITALITGILWSCLLYSQVAVISSGGNATGSAGTTSFSIGQVVYTAHAGSSGSIAQGVQHAYEIFTVGMNETELNISVSVFPNPTTNSLTLQFSDYNNENLSYLLFDMNGKLLINGQVTDKYLQINMASLPAATYFINIINQENKKVQSFKIIKN
jgi:hypothetical protein